MKMLRKYQLAVWLSIRNFYSHFTKVTLKCERFGRIVEPCKNCNLNCGDHDWHIQLFTHEKQEIDQDHKNNDVKYMYWLYRNNAGTWAVFE